MDGKLPWLRTCGKKIVDDTGSPLLLRGFGLGGWLLPEGYMWGMGPDCDRPRRMEELIRSSCGEAFAESFWRQYRNTFISEGDIQLIAEKGFNSLRLPFNSRTLFDVSSGPPVFREQEIARVDACVGWCRRAGIYVILDMHGAPGGQTGTNIDDSERDLPELFTEEGYREQCVAMWLLLARRYAEEPTVAAYDLLNEPLAPQFCHLAPQVMPLYRRIRDAIRSVDPRHMIMLEGIRWASDVSIFSDLVPGDFDSNWMLQFHKYWNRPDEESMQSFLDAREQLEVPLIMGEGGENNLPWYTSAFPLLESLDISWNFWTWKKIACHNSPVTFPQPMGWPPLPGGQNQKELWEAFLAASTERSEINHAVFCALNRQAPLTVPAEQFSSSRINGPRLPGAILRKNETATIRFKDGHHGEPEYQRQRGEDQPADQELYVALQSGESLSYLLRGGPSLQSTLALELRTPGSCSLSVLLDDHEVSVLQIPGAEASAETGTDGTVTDGTMADGWREIEICTLEIQPGAHMLTLLITTGAADISRIILKEADL